MERHTLFPKVGNIDKLRGKHIVVGDAIWGDNGKGKITNFLAFYIKNILGLELSICVRPNGGHNAGHEVFAPWGPFGPQASYKGFVVPMAILQNIVSLLGPGCCFNPQHLFDIELKTLANQGVDTDLLRISYRANIITSLQTQLDAFYEQLKNTGSASAIGTTKKGIGPAYEAKAARINITVADLLGNEKTLMEKISFMRQIYARLTENYNSSYTDTKETHFEDFGSRAIFEELLPYRDKIAKIARDEQNIYKNLRLSGAVGIVEMGQGTFLDNTFGTLPFVTSSPTTIPGGIYGAGLSHKDIGYSIIVAKGTYMTRVGNGPFPTEMPEAEDENFRQLGKEFGTTTGRARRCGYLDLSLMRLASSLNGADCLALTKMDIVDGPIKVSTAYHLPSKIHKGHNDLLFNPPADTADWSRLKPCYETIPAWSAQEVLQMKDLYGSYANLSMLPPNMQKLIAKIEAELKDNEAPKIELVSFGPSLQDMAIMKNFLR